jgi:hypothetical protein
VHAVHPVAGHATHRTLTVHTTLAIHVTHRTRGTLAHRRQVAVCAKAVRAHAHATGTHVTTTEATVAAVLVEMLTLQLVLDAFAVRGIADERKDGTDAIDEKGSLLRISVVESSLSNDQIA